MAGSNGGGGVGSGVENPMRAAYNASVRKKKSYHRISWDFQRGAIGGAGVVVPAVPPILPAHCNNV